MLNNSTNTTSANTVLMIRAENTVKTKFGRIFKYNTKIITTFV